MIAAFTAASFYKLLGILLLSPLWWPVAKALWRDAEDALRDEGGVFGRTPTAREVAELEQRYGQYESPLISVLRDSPEARRRR